MLELLLKQMRGYSKTVLPNIIIDDGMSEVYCRTLTNTKLTTGQILNYSSLYKKLYMSDNLSSTNFSLLGMINIAKQNINKCIVGILESWEETLQIIHYWYPWLQIESLTEKATSTGEGRGQRMRIAHRY